MLDVALVRLSSYEAVREALRHGDLKQALYDEAGVVLEGTLLTLHGQEHRTRRRLESRLFRPEALRGYEMDVVRPAIAATIAPFVTRGWVDVVELSRRVTLSLSALIAGIDCPHDSAEGTGRLLDYVWRFSAGATVAHAVDKAAVVAEAAEALAGYDREFFQPSYRRRRELVERFRAGQVEEARLPRDVLTLLLREGDQLALPLDLIRRETCGYLQAATGSTAMAVANTVHETLTWLERHPSDRARLERDPRFVQRCVHEALRLHPASPVASRRTLARVRLGCGVEIPEHALVQMDLMAANQDPAVFGADAHRFRPGRERPEGVPAWGLSFGAGAHTCIGRILDAGMEPDSRRGEPDEPIYGSVTLIVQTLFQHRVRPHPELAPRQDETSTRPHWGFYPVLLG